MQRRALSATFFVIGLFTGNAAFGCGDKLLAISRGLRFQHIHAARQANLVIYSAGTQNGAALDSARLQTTLKQTVRNLQVVRSGPQLDQALKSGQVDVVLVYFTEATAIVRLLQSAASRPVIVPVLIKPSKADLAAAQNAYHFALKATADEIEFLNAVDEAMKSKVKPPQGPDRRRAS